MKSDILAALNIEGCYKYAEAMGPSRVEPLYGEIFAAWYWAPVWGLGLVP